MGARTLRIVIVDDEALVRGGLRLLIERHADIEVVGEAGDGRAALELLATTHADLVLLDVRMPVLDGLATARELLARPAPPKVVMLTTFGEDEYVHAALSAGASGFLLKTTPPEELLRGIRIVADGHALLDPAVTHGVIARLGPPPGQATVPAGVADLTPRELEVLRLLAQGLSNAEIADALVVSRATVKTHVNHVLMKLDLRDRTQAAVLAHESGLVRPGPEG